MTTLHEEDLPIVREALQAKFEPLSRARLTATSQSFAKIAGALPLKATNETIADVYIYVSRMPPPFQFQSVPEIRAAVEFIDTFLDCLTLSNRLTVQNSPCPWRDGFSAAAAREMMTVYREKFRVPVEEMLHRSGLLKKLNRTLVMMASEGRPNVQDVVLRLSELETVHKVIVLYLWFSHRHVIAFPDQKKALDLRHLTELGMDWCLEVMHQLRIKAEDPTVTAREEVMRRRPGREESGSSLPSISGIYEDGKRLSVST